MLFLLPEWDAPSLAPLYNLSPGWSTRWCVYYAFFVRWSVIMPLLGTRRYTGLAEKPMKQRRRYLAYLLRLWKEGAAPGGEALGGSPDPLQWRASLEWPQSGRLQAFASLEDLFAFLEEETRSGSPGSEYRRCQDRKSGDVR